MSKQQNKSRQKRRAIGRPPRSFGLDPDFKREVEAQYDDIQDFSDAPDELKMSAKLIGLAEPYLEEDIPYPTLFECAAIAWNECTKEDCEVTTDYAPIQALMDYTSWRGLIDILKARKRELFPNDTRGIRAVKLVDKAHGEVSVNVVSDMNMAAAMRLALQRLTEDQ